ncbi:phage portal protein [Bifidobacterium porcinum]|uniref:phage portal protein n=1 Tax=Bifidobacterium porcinum TaxID=212365 RepID=UPI0039964389
MAYQLEWKNDEGRDWLAAPLTVGNVHAADSGDVFGDEELHWLQVLSRVWHEHYARNALRTMYYDGKEMLHDIAGSIPESMRADASCPVDWPRKAVSSLADKSVLAGFNIDPNVDDPGVVELADRVGLVPMMGQAITSAYKHSCAFLTVYPDAETRDVQVVARAADWSAAVWDRRRNRIRCALTVTENDRLGRATAMTLWLPGRAWELTADGTGWSAACTWRDPACPVTPVVPIAYDRQLDRPFGRSRISRTLMALTDMGFRTMTEMDTAAAFYAAPRVWFLGLDPDAFQGSKWSRLMTSLNAVSRDEDGLTPTIQQLQQASMTPYSSMLETIAMMVSSATDIPAEALGIRLSNPTSVEAINAAEQRLSRIAERQNREFTRQLMQLMRVAMYMQGGYQALSDVDLSGITPVWEPVNVSSDAAKADWLTKVGSVDEALAKSDVGRRHLGLSESEIQSVKAWESKQRAQNTLDAIRQSVNQPEQGQTGTATVDAGTGGTQQSSAKPSENGGRLS